MKTKIKICQKCHNSLDESSFEIVGTERNNEWSFSNLGFSVEFKRDEICKGCRSRERAKLEEE